MVKNYIIGGVAALILSASTVAYLYVDNLQSTIEKLQEDNAILRSNISQLEGAVASKENLIKQLKIDLEESKTAFSTLEKEKVIIEKEVPVLKTIKEEADPVKAQEIARKDFDASIDYVEQSTASD